MKKVSLAFSFFFIGFLTLALMTMLACTYVSFFHNYSVVTDTYSYSIDWFSIKRFDTTFWDTFKTIDKMLTYAGFNPFNAIPAIPQIEYFSLDTGGFILNVFIAFVNGITSIINFIVTIFRSVGQIVQFVYTFIVSFSVWISNSSYHLEENIYHTFDRVSSLVYAIQVVS